MKKIFNCLLSIILLLSCVVTLNLNHIKAFDDYQYLKEFKDNYRNTSYYQYTPQNMDEFNSLHEDEVLEVFEGIKVSKRILDENLILDIEKVTLDDLVNEKESRQIVPIGGGGGNSVSLPSGYHSAIVTEKNTYLSGTNKGKSTYVVKMYLSHLALTDYLVQCNRKTTEQAIINLVASSAVSMIIGSVPVFDDIFSAAMDAAELGNLVMDYQFYTKADELYFNDSKAIVTISNSSRSIVAWTSNTYSIRNVNTSSYKIESVVEVLKDRK